MVDGSDRSISLAVAMLRAGEVVGVPTETVYGLAADASNPEAVLRVFAAKGRPGDHPLIVHLGRGANLADWARHIPDRASRLAEAFWPGPLTTVLDRHPSVLDAVTGGQDTVALRIPSHPVILQDFGGGLAAPSANRFGHVSPTTARHVCDGMAESKCSEEQSSSTAGVRAGSEQVAVTHPRTLRSPRASGPLGGSCVS